MIPLADGHFAEDILPKNILPNGHFADGRFAEQIFWRTEILPNGQFV
jgi:hypothetical protein